MPLGYMHNRDGDERHVVALASGVACNMHVLKIVDLFPCDPNGYIDIGVGLVVVAGGGGEQ